jgi:energy-coupling factor transporter transmembrane protein EcfT
MTTNMYLGFPFGVISVFLHTVLLCTETRRSWKFYDASLFLWVCGNFIWMTIEFTSVHPSSDIHWGPHVPTGGVSDHSVYVMTQAKTILFLIGFLIQVSLYICVACNIVPMPEQDNEDIVIRNEATRFLLGRSTFTRDTNDVNAIMDLEEEVPDNQELHSGQSDAAAPITLAMIENGYIIFWISKDMFWSFGTGDLNRQRNSVLAYETLAMCGGFTALCIYLVTAYIYRRRTLRFLDSLTTVFWISANYTWMCGEFFIRYHNLQFDDADPGDDRKTRIASATLFAAGVACQVYVVIVLWLRHCAKKRGRNVTVSHFRNAPTVDTLSVVQYATLATTTSPHHQRV